MNPEEKIMKPLIFFSKTFDTMEKTLTDMQSFSEEFDNVKLTATKHSYVIRGLQELEPIILKLDRCIKENDELKIFSERIKSIIHLYNGLIAHWCLDIEQVPVKASPVVH